jgi:spore germination cell wall hydrolase CwlJ-like protein
MAVRGVRVLRPLRPEQPTLLFRAIFAGAFLAFSSSQLAHQDRAPGAPLQRMAMRGVDPTVTGSIVPPGVATDVVRSKKGDLIAKPHVVAKPFVGGAVKAPAVYASAIAAPAAPAFKRPTIVAAAIAIMPVLSKPPAAAGKAPAIVAAAVAMPIRADSGGEPPILLTYAPARDPLAEKAPFDAVIAKPKVMTSVVVPNVDAAHAWVNDPLPASVHNESEIKCLANAIYFEARGEPQEGQLAVAQVVLNRVKNPAYPDTICSVVYQNKNMRHRCQFSFACDGIKDRISDQAAWNRSLMLARKVVANSTDLFISDVGTSTHYHATYVRPRWARKMEKMDKIGAHIFYKTYGGGWS